MRQRRKWLIGAAALAAPLHAQGAMTETVAPAVAGSAVEAFYSSHPGTLLWFRDADSRAAAARLPALLRQAPLDGLADGPVLAAGVEAAIARGQPDDDRILSSAWVAYVQALKDPVDGISYGDPALALKPPSAGAILADAARAASMTALLDQAAAVNPLYTELRDAAEKQGVGSDPRVEASLDRLRLLPATGRTILVDVANAQLMMIEDGKVAGSMKVIVGKKSAATPLLAGTIHYVTFNPYWHIPQDVARRKVAPVVLKRGVSYLKAARYQAVAGFGAGKEDPVDPSSIDWKAVAAGTTEVHIRQLSGPQNMMGAMKFGFVNDYGIFLHDTPHKDLFAKAKRNLSLGCIRLEHPERLASWLLGREPTPPGGDSEQLVQVDKGVPIYISYLSARVGDDGTIAYAEDVYGLDTPGAVKPVVTATADTAQ